jgi:DNA (cytosine-5)-methyltransferase 1
MAGIKVVHSFEWWREANVTHNRNFGTDHDETDIRQLKLRDLDRFGKIDVVVGSPPCTQFSFSNRGGSGDIEDGLVDIKKFLDVVAYLKPRFWAMENVPRVAEILRQSLQPGGPLERYRKLVKVIEIVDSADYGVPQNRRRMIAGDFPIELFRSYKEKATRRTLGDVIESLAADPAIDPVYGFKLSRAKLTDHEHEAPLSDEERRLNEESKRYHPVYNLMQFPDRFDRPSRTVTATCTRVSRESIVIRDPKTRALRRLTIRERASVQSFPITYQYFGNSYSNRQKMVGNAVPPLLTYFVASSMRNVPAARAVDLPRTAEKIHPLPSVCPGPVRMDSPGENYPAGRRFRAAIPGLRFGSGVRFELANINGDSDRTWKVGFYFGPSKDFKSVAMDERLEEDLLAALPESARQKIKSVLDRVDGFIPEGGGQALQYSWSRQAIGSGPFDLVDESAALIPGLVKALTPSENVCSDLIDMAARKTSGPIPAKLKKNAIKIVAGLLVGSRVNAALAQKNGATIPSKHRRCRAEDQLALVA